MSQELRPLAIGLGALVLAAAPLSAASAAVLTGTFTPEPYIEQIFDLPFNDGPGIYRVGFDISRPAIGDEFQIKYTFIYDWYDPATHAYLGGNDVPTDKYINFGPETTHHSEFFQIIKPYDLIVSNGWEEIGRYDHTSLSLDLVYDQATPVNYTLFAIFAHGVPEPAAWTLMILGFGAAGVALRRQTSARAA